MGIRVFLGLVESLDFFFLSCLIEIQMCGVVCLWVYLYVLCICVYVCDVFGMSVPVSVRSMCGKGISTF